MKINGTFTLRSHLLWVTCIVAAAVAVNLLLLYDVEKTFYVLFAIFCALPLFKIYPVKYGLKYQSLPCYLLIPASNSERFTVQMLLTVGIGLLYAFIGILLLFGCNQLLHSFIDGYPLISINGFYEPLHDALCKAFLLPDIPMAGWCIALNICWMGLTRMGKSPNRQRARCRICCAIPSGLSSSTVWMRLCSINL